MKHAVIVAHPDRDSFNVTVARRYGLAAEALGHQVELRDLYRIGFDPRLQASEIPRPGGFAPGEDVKAERAAIGDADVFVLVYPLWFNGPPAMLKGYFDRVFGMGFGYSPHGSEGNRPMLAGRKLISFTSSGAPTDWMNQEGSLAALRNLVDDHLAGVCGFEVVDHIHFGGVFPGMVIGRVESCEAEVAAAVARHFPAD
jgi:NAD(P)H dehydrogenase (quinone)